MRKRTDREIEIVNCYLRLMTKNLNEIKFLCNPDEEQRNVKAPDYLYKIKNKLVLIEHTSIRNHDETLVSLKKINEEFLKIFSSVTRKGTYSLYSTKYNPNFKSIKKILKDKNLINLVQKAVKLKPGKTVSNDNAHIIKTANTDYLFVTVSYPGLIVPPFDYKIINDLIAQTHEKFTWRKCNENILLIDSHNASVGPTLLKNYLKALKIKNMKVILVVNYPYSEGMKKMGEIIDNFEFINVN